MDAHQISKLNEWYERQQMCKCGYEEGKQNTALFLDMKVVKCQRCQKPVIKRIAVNWLLYNGYSHEEIENMLSHNKNKEVSL